MGNLVGDSINPSIAAVEATHSNGEAVHAATNATNVAAVAAYGLNESGTGAALYADKRG